MVNSMLPYIRGGAEILADDLVEQLRLFGHETDLVKIPFPSDYEGPLMNTITASRLLRFDAYERVIAFKFPAYCIRHEGKVMWLLHQFRQMYELNGTEYGLEQNEVTKRMFQIVKKADDLEIVNSRHIYTIAKEVSKRLMTYNGIPSEVIYTPLKDRKIYHCEKTGDYIFYPNRINSMKRQHLAVQAMKYVKSGVKLIIAGQCPEHEYMKTMTDFIAENKIGDKVTIMDEWITDEKKAELLSKCLGVISIPYKEDSPGLVTQEAQYSCKAVITCFDSGGTNEFVEDGVNGYIVENDPEQIAKKMDQLYEDKQKAEKMGLAGYNSVIEKDITWESTIRRLLK